MQNKEQQVDDYTVEPNIADKYISFANLWL